MLQMAPKKPPPETGQAYGVFITKLRGQTGQPRPAAIPAFADVQVAAVIYRVDQGDLVAAPDPSLVTLEVDEGGPLGVRVGARRAVLVRHRKLIVVIRWSV